MWFPAKDAGKTVGEMNRRIGDEGIDQINTVSSRRNESLLPLYSVERPNKKQIIWKDLKEK